MRLRPDKKCDHVLISKPLLPSMMPIIIIGNASPFPVGHLKSIPWNWNYAILACFDERISDKIGKIKKFFTWKMELFSKKGQTIKFLSIQADW